MASDDASTSPAPRRAVIVHPFLFALFPALFLFSHNREEASLGVLVMPATLSLLLAMILLLLGRPILRTWSRAGIFATFTLLLFFSYGHVQSALADAHIGGFVLGRQRFLFPAWGVLFIGGLVVAARASTRFREYTTILNIAALSLVGMSLIPIVSSAVGSNGTPAPDPQRIEIGGTAAAASPRDIYYLVIERYASEETLRTHYGYDSSAFTGFLKRNGFFLPEKSTANYPNTTHSLAASFNIRYLDDLADRIGPASGDMRPLIRMIKDNAVVRFLKQHGYRYLHIGNWWEATRTSPLADENHVFDPLSEFTRVLYEQTIAWPIAKRLGLTSTHLDTRRTEFKRFPFQLRALRATRRIKGPKYVLAHLFTGHDPFVFDRNGRFVDEDADKRRSRVQKYADQIAYGTVQVQALIEDLLSVPVDRRPIILVAADEGPFGLPEKRTGPPLGTGWLAGTPSQLKQKYGILTALYLPGVDTKGLPATLTPVNIFRVVLDRYFGADLPLLPDRNIVWAGLKDLYTFTDITNIIRS